ncbi:MAG: 1,4-alpha-glucan branching enzyme, partial [Rhodoferax sp.]|nr:1,4-alpha-glucan branching enzyme [Rhodoferax sp.]
MLTAKDITALMQAEHADAFSVLGMHALAGEVWVQALLPGARQVTVLERQTGQPRATLPRCPGSAVFSGQVAGASSVFDYQLQVDWHSAPERTTPERQILEDA